jgi:hypothetical protein
MSLPALLSESMESGPAMSDLRKAAQMALEALDGVLDTYGEPLDLMTISGGAYEALECRDAITALRAALAQPEPEPVAWLQTENFIDPEGLWDERKTFNCEGDGTPLYTASPQRKPLTEEEIGKATEHIAGMHCAIVDEIARAIEAAHGIGGEE